LVFRLQSDLCMGEDVKWNWCSLVGLPARGISTDYYQISTLAQLIKSNPILSGR